MNIIDSSAWLEVLVDGPNRIAFHEVIEAGELIVPAITLFEVCRRVRAKRSAAEAARVESRMRRFTIVELTADRASAVSIIYAAALEFTATVWTQHDDFKGFETLKTLQLYFI